MGKIYAAKTNHQTNPLGFYMNRVVFSWKIEDALGKKQECARIIISKQDDFKILFYDTEFTNLDSLGTKVVLDLTPRTRYYWKVTVVTDDGEEIESETQWFETSKISEPWIGKWITCDSTEPRHPVFTKGIYPFKSVDNARLYICGIGLYETYFQAEGKLEASKIGNEYLAPFCNDYNSWIQYQTYDVTEQMQESGELSVLLGNGWYKGRFGLNRFEQKGFYGNQWKLIAELHLRYEDGTTEVIGTDESWNVKRSNITFSNIYDGEKRDDTLPAVDAVQAELTDAPKGNLMERLSLPVVAHEVWTPKELIHTPSGEQVFDLGQEITGVFTLHVNVPKGTEIKIQTGEVLQNGNFYNENLRSALSEYIYVSDGIEKDITPKFTFYGYRYVKIEGIPNLKCQDFTGISLYSDFEQIGKISTGHNLVNQLISNVEWGMKDNFLDVPTDCPQRDERTGWTGDTQVFSATASYLADTYAFYRKYLFDMFQEQQKTNGMVPEMIPSVGSLKCSSVWGDASCIIPWNVYRFSGDVSILEDQYDSMKAWVNYIRKTDGENHGWRDMFHYGDWLALDKVGAGSNGVYGATDEGYIANVYYAASADMVADAAALLGYLEDESEFRSLAKEQWTSIKKEYFTSTGRCAIKTQTGLLLALKFHLSSDEEKVRKMLKKMLQENGNKLATGFVGTPLLCNILTENGMEDIAYQLLLNEQYPGWLNEVKLGATTIWERWNSLDSQGMISSTGMNSMNHYSYGAILEWMFRHVGGINLINSSPGARKVSICPIPNWNLKNASVCYDSACGKYECCWEILDSKTIKITIAVPFGGEAEVVLPFAQETLYEDQRNPLFADVSNGVCLIGAGNYEIEYETRDSLKVTYDTNSKMNDLLGNQQIRSFLATLFDVEMIPAVAYDYTFRQVAELFSGSTDEEQFKQIDLALSQF